METSQSINKNLPEIETYETHEDFRNLATQSLESKEKAIYYMGSVENLAAVFDEEYDRGVLYSHKNGTGHIFKDAYP